MQQHRTVAEAAAPSHSAGHGHGGEDATRVSTAFTPQTGRKVKFAAVAVVVALLIAFLVVHFLKSSEQGHLREEAAASAQRRTTVSVITVKGGNGQEPLTLPGATAAWYESTIYSRVNGFVAKWYVDIGEHVKQGQVLALIETPELDADLSAARAELSAAQAQERVRAAEAEFARTTNERWRDSPKGVVSEQEREAKRADYDSAVAKLNAAKAEIALDQAKVDRLLALTRFKQVIAPIDGTITERRIDIGNLVTAGSTSGNTFLYKVSQETPIRIFVDVPQSAAGDLMKPGGPVEVKAANLPDRPFSAKIARTARAIDPQSRTLRVEVDLANEDLALVPGMYVNVNFQLQTDNLVRVPPAALVFRSSGPEVAVVDASGHIAFRKVTIARDNGSSVALSSGVVAGDRVVLNVSSQIRDGDQVAISEGADASPTTALKAH